MSVKDITAEAVLAAIAEGHDTIDKLAGRFGVLQASAALRLTLAQLGTDGRVKRFPIPGSPTMRFEVVELWDPSENCYCGGPEETFFPHRLGTGRHCRQGASA